MTLRPSPRRPRPQGREPGQDAGRPPGRPALSEGADPFDLWLRRSLHADWDRTLEEKVPEDLLRLISDDRSEWEALKARWLPAEAPEELPPGS